jgi:hypothetical protein
MSLLDIANGKFLVEDFVYHRGLVDEDSAPKKKPETVAIPKIEEGAAIPYIFGRVRVTRPILAWTSSGISYINSGGGVVDGRQLYAMSMLFVLGVPFGDGDSTNRIHRMWQGDVEYAGLALGSEIPPYAIAVNLEDLDGDGDMEEYNRGIARVGARRLTVEDEALMYTAGAVEFLNGNADQQLVDPLTPWTPTTRAGYQMTTTTGLGLQTTPENMVGYRGVLSAFLYSAPVFDGGLGHFIYGLNPQLGAFSFEVSSYKDDASYPATGIMARSGYDSNPINALYDILISPRKLGLSTSLIDQDSFTEAATTCYQESHGYSRCFDERQEAREMIREILKQVDGVIFEDSQTGKLKIKLIRADYVTADLPLLTKDNGTELRDFAVGGYTDITNKIRVVYSNRERSYIDDSAIAQNPANAVGQDGLEREEVIRYPGCCYFALAARLAARELDWRSRPIMKCMAYVDRTFYRLNPGDAVMVQWQKPDVSNIVFRVVSVNRGVLTDGKIAIDLIQDVNFVYRGGFPEPPTPLYVGGGFEVGGPLG